MTAERAAAPESLLAAFNSGAEQAFAAFATAYARTPGTWADGIQAALASLLDFLDGSPALTRLCFVDALHAGPAALERRDRALDRFAQLLERAAADSATPRPDVVSEAVAGGVFEVLRARALQNGGALSEALPEITVIALAPFLGNDEAARRAAQAAPDGSSSVTAAPSGA